MINRVAKVAGRIRLMLLGRADNITLASMLAVGAIACGIYSVAYIAIKGVVLDETVIPAEIIAGAVRYPLGHPHQLFYPQAYALFNYLAAALWMIAPSPWLISALRNFLFMFLSLFVPYAAAVLLTRQPVWGFIATFLTLSEGSIRFDGVYPMWVYPDAYSTGHISLQLVVLIIVLLLGRFWLSGGLLLGAMAALHPGMAQLVWPWSACYLFWDRIRHQGRARYRLVGATLVGLAICAVLAAVIFVQTQSAAIAAPYDVSVNGALIYRQFELLTDPHRRLFVPASPGYLLNPVAFFVIGGLALWSAKRRTDASADADRRNLRWILFAGMIAWIYMYGAWLFQYIMGSLPMYIAMSMPFRLSNVTAVLLIPLTVVALAWTYESLPQRAKFWGILLVTTLLCAEAAMLLLNRSTAYQYLVFITWGILFGMGLYANRHEGLHTFASLLAVFCIAGISLVVLRWTRETVYLILAGAASFGLLAVGEHWSPFTWDFYNRRLASWIGAANICAGIVICLAVLRGFTIWDLRESIYNTADTRAGSWAEMTPYENALNLWLAAHASPDEMILPPIDPRSELQSKTGHPVLMESETLQLLTYMPGLSPVIAAMARDLYGIDYANADQLKQLARNERLPTDSPVWIGAWQKRELAEWQLLGHKYGFRLVLSPTRTPLHLQAVLPGPVWTLYVIN